LLLISAGKDCACCAALGEEGLELLFDCA
jgi:hypothetical protein